MGGIADSFVLNFRVRNNKAIKTTEQFSVSHFSQPTLFILSPFSFMLGQAF